MKKVIEISKEIQNFKYDTAYMYGKILEKYLKSRSSFSIFEMNLMEEERLFRTISRVNNEKKISTPF